MIFTYTGTATTTRAVVAAKAAAQLGCPVTLSAVRLVAVVGAAWLFQVAL